MFYRVLRHTQPITNFLFAYSLRIELYYLPYFTHTDWFISHDFLYLQYRLYDKEFKKSEYEDLFFLLSTNGDAIIGLNTQLTMSNLIRKLHDLDRPMKSCEINGEKVTFDVFSVGLSGSIKLMTSVITWQNLMPYMSVKTRYGTYLIETTEITEQDLLTLKIKK